MANSRDEKLAWGLVAAWVCACFVAAWDALPLPNLGFAQDLGIMIDAGWRFYQGQRTHADYHSPLGPVLGMLFGIPMRIAGPRYESLTLLPPVVSAIAAFWTCALCRGVLPAVPRAAVAAAVGGVTGGVYHLGFPPEILSFATFYNRVGFGLLAIAALAAFLPRREDCALQSQLLDCSAIVATITMFFLKANFAMTAIVLVGIAAACQPRSRRDVWVAAGVGISALLMFLWSIGFRVDRMLSDFLMASDARSEIIGNYFFPVRNTLANSDVLIVMALYTTLCIPVRSWTAANRYAFGVHMVVLWLPFLVGLATTFAQSHGDGRGVVPAVSGLAASLAWLYCPGVTIRLPSGGRTIEPARLNDDDRADGVLDCFRRRACAAAVVAGAILFIVPHAQSYVQWFSLSQSIKGRQFSPEPLQQLFVGSYVNNWGEGFAPLTNEGCELLRSSCGSEDGVQYIDVANLFNFACGLRSPRNSALWWDSTIYTERRHPAEDSFSDTRYLLLPKLPMHRDAIKRWLDIYGAMLDAKYFLQAETANFKLYRLK